jgi:arylsulfatase A-like enzyme
VDLLTADNADIADKDRKASEYPRHLRNLRSTDRKTPSEDVKVSDFNSHCVSGGNIPALTRRATTFARFRFGNRTSFCVLGAMSVRLRTFCLAFAIVCASAAAAEPRTILFLTADGFRTDYIEWHNPPHLKHLISEGVRVTNAKNVFPTLTTPNMTSLVTGALPRTTHIAVNSQYVRELDQIVSRPRDNAAETIAETLRRAGWSTAALNHFMLERRGADIYRAPGYDDSDKTADALIDLLKKKKARFIGAIFGATDKAGHRFGPQSAEVKEAVLAIDRAVGRIVATLKELGIYEETLITFNSDHGMSAYEKKAVSIEPARALTEAGFRVATKDTQLNAETQIVVLDGGVRVVYFRKVSDPEKQKALAVLASIEGAEVLGREKLDALGCHDNRSGDAIVSPLPGYTMSGAGGRGGLHGRFTEQNPILFFRGPGFKRGAVVESARTIDVVPTLLRLVNVPPAKTVDGKVIAGALEL